MIELKEWDVFKLWDHRLVFGDSLKARTYDLLLEMEQVLTVN